MQETPRANRFHISLFGKTNVGKSTIINSITSQPVSVVSDFRGTTTDPVYKAMELPPLGPVVFVDTAGIDDDSEIGELRIKKTVDVLNKTDMVVMVFSAEEFYPIDNLDEFLKLPILKEMFAKELTWYSEAKKLNKTIIGAFNKCDLFRGLNSEKEEQYYIDKTLKMLKELFPIEFVVLYKEKKFINRLKDCIVKNTPVTSLDKPLIGDKISEGDKVILVAPQDIEAPKGRLILPQVQVLRDLLDHKAMPLTVTLDNLENALKVFNNKPDLVITDSQVFKEVEAILPKEVPLTSFSILMARFKGDLELLYQGAKKIKLLKEGDKVLIAEACTHHHLKGDIAREKLPTWLTNFCPGVTVDNYSGHDFPENLEDYDLVIHCGSCMFNRNEFMHRMNHCKSKNLAITNFGIAIAELNGILDRVMEPLIK
ncbi:MAG: [FeFe] hydrogenase H-cluster maturation GTPase HydF [Sarcina sp.]